MSNLQVMLTTNGVLLSVTADVKTATGGSNHYPLPCSHGPVPAAVGFCAHRGRYLPGATPTVESIFLAHPRNLFRTILRQLLGLTEADQTLEVRGTQYSKLVLDPSSQRVLPQLQSPWTGWHKKDGAGQWAIVLDMPTRPLNTPHVAPDVLHQIYPSCGGRPISSPPRGSSSRRGPPLTSRFAKFLPNRHRGCWRHLPCCSGMRKSWVR